MSSEDTLYEKHAEMCLVFTSAHRLKILDLLREGEKTVSELTGLTGLRQSNVSQHLAMMRQRGILEARREGTRLFYLIRNRKILQAFDIIREVLRERMSESGELAAAMARSKRRR